MTTLAGGTSAGGTSAGGGGVGAAGPEHQQVQGAQASSMDGERRVGSPTASVGGGAFGGELKTEEALRARCEELQGRVVATKTRLAQEQVELSIAQKEYTEILRGKSRVAREKRRLAEEQARIAQEEEARIQKALEDAAQAGVGEVTIIPPPGRRTASREGENRNNGLSQGQGQHQGGSGTGSAARASAEESRSAETDKSAAACSAETDATASKAKGQNDSLCVRKRARGAEEKDQGAGNNDGAHPSSPSIPSNYDLPRPPAAGSLVGWLGTWFVLRSLFFARMPSPSSSPSPSPPPAASCAASCAASSSASSVGGASFGRRIQSQRSTRSKAKSVPSRPDGDRVKHFLKSVEDWRYDRGWRMKKSPDSEAYDVSDDYAIVTMIEGDAPLLARFYEWEKQEMWTFLTEHCEVGIPRGSEFKGWPCGRRVIVCPDKEIYADNDGAISRDELRDFMAQPMAKNVFDQFVKWLTKREPKPQYWSPGDGAM
eukprot:g12083.t4